MTSNERMLEAFDKFKGQVDEAYTTVREQLEAGNFIGAQATLAAIAKVHAKTSLSLRTYCIKRGLLPEEE